jgi:hypothetical protein
LRKHWGGWQHGIPVWSFDTGAMTDISMRTADGTARPFFIPRHIAYRIVMALRREHLHPADQIDGAPVP